MTNDIALIIFIALLGGVYILLASWYHFHKRKLTGEIVLEYTLVAVIFWFLVVSLL